MLDLYGKNNPCLYELRQWYIDEQNQEGQRVFGIGYGKSKYNYYDNGEEIPKEARKLMRSRMDLLEYFGKVNPYVSEQDRSYYYWYQNEMKNLTERPVLEIELQEAIAGDKDLQVKLGAILEENKRLALEIEKIKMTKTWKIRGKLIKFVRR